jgi:hypothetical protein
MWTEAERLHNRGLWVVPCNGKEPLVKEWQKKRLTLTELKAMLVGTHNNIALVLNQSDLIDVECDGDDAEVKLQEMFGGEVPDTPTWRSKRGFHRLFRRPPGLPEKAKLEIDGVEFHIGNGKGALSTVPPSVHESDFQYRWLPGSSIHKIDPAELPDRVADRLRMPESPQKSTPPADGDILKGQRNEELFKLACDLFGSKQSAASVERMVSAENNARCKPPLSAAEIADIVKSAQKQAAKGQKSHAALLLEIALADSELWHTDEAAYATIQRGGHREHWPLRSKGYKQWLAKRFYDREQGVVGSQTLQDVLNILEANANEGPAYPCLVRVAGYEGRIYIDLADEAWRAIEVDKVGWRIVDDPPVRFQRPKRMLPLPEPESGGSVDELRQFLRLTGKEHAEGWILTEAWLLDAFRPDGPHPILKTIGGQGSGKTMAGKVLPGSIDPNSCLTRGAPKSERDLRIAAANSWLCAFDNLSYIPPELSDALCRLSSGGGFGTRTSYADDEETVFSGQRPILLNGIEHIGTRGDLLDRSLAVEIPEMKDADRLSEKVLEAKFVRACPRILGALLDAVSTALKNLAAVEQSHRIWPRMADFAQWVVAAAPALGFKADAFLEAYEHSRQVGDQVALEACPITAALLAMLKTRKNRTFVGTATALLNKLAVGQDTRAKNWPKNPRALSGILNRLAPNLRQAGVTADMVTINNKKLWRLKS